MQRWPCIDSASCSSAQHRNCFAQSGIPGAVMIASRCNLLLYVVGSAGAFQIREFEMQRYRNAVSQRDSSARGSFGRCQRVATLRDFYV